MREIHSIQAIEIAHITTITSEVRDLIEELDRELSEKYVPEQRHGLALETIFQPHILFFVARINGIAEGCGGVAMFPDFAEVKRMYVRNRSRGQGIADAIMEKLETETRDAGMTTLRLETGMHSLAALKFYNRCGFQPCEAFEPYSSMPASALATSIFLEKKLYPDGSSS